MSEPARPGPGASPCLLELVHGLLERTYQMQTGLVDIGSFVIGDHGFRTLYGVRERHHGARSAEANGAQTLVREIADELRACIYYPDSLIRQLERHPPQGGVCDDNVDPFAALVEELDHLLMIAERSARGREVSLFELELHANVSKHLVLSRFLAGRGRRLTERRRRWLRHHLFEKLSFSDSDASVRDRYREAARWALRLIDALSEWRSSERIAALRRFHRASAHGKVRLIRSLA